MALVDRRRRIMPPSASLSTEVSCRFGRKRRRFLLLAWLTLLPNITPLPVTAQRRAIGQVLNSVNTKTKVRTAPPPGGSEFIGTPHGGVKACAERKMPAPS